MMSPLDLPSFTDQPRNMLDSLTVRCFAKINLFLRVLGRREDGFHEIETLFQCIDLHDTLTISRRDEQGGMKLICDDPQLPCDESNLALRAAREFAQRSGIKLGLEIRLEKKIPVAAGLGGGSSDAAASLRALNQMTCEPLSEAELLEAAAELGSDVPYFLLGGTALGKGRGEELTSLDDTPVMNLVLLVPNLSISAASAYEQFDLTFGAQISDSTHRLSLGESNSSGMSWQNDLERGVFRAHPKLANLKDGLLEAGAAEAVMSGSGPVIAGRFDRPSAAEQAADLFRARGVGVIRCCSLTKRDFRRMFILARKREA